MHRAMTLSAQSARKYWKYRVSWVAVQSLFGSMQKTHVSGADRGGNELEELWRDKVLSSFGGELSVRPDLSSKPASRLTYKLYTQKMSP